MGKVVHIDRIDLDKLGLTTVSEESKYTTWRAKFDMAVDNVWNGLEEVLKKVKVMKTECTEEMFERLMSAYAIRSEYYEPIEWSYKFVAKKLYRILFMKTDGKLQKVVAGCDKTKDGIEAYRLLTAHCDPYTFNTAGTLMESITAMATKQPSSTENIL